MLRLTLVSGGFKENQEGLGFPPHFDTHPCPLLQPALISRSKKLHICPVFVLCRTNKPPCSFVYPPQEKKQHVHRFRPACPPEEKRANRQPADFWGYASLRWGLSILGVASQFCPGIRLSRKPSKTQGKRIRFSKRTMVEKKTLRNPAQTDPVSKRIVGIKF